MSNYLKILDNQYFKIGFYFLIVFSIISVCMVFFIDWYISPALDGFNMTMGYLQSTSDNFYLDIIGFDQQEISSNFLEKLEELSNDDAMTVSESVSILNNDLYDMQESLANKLYNVIVYQFSPFFLFIFVIYFIFNIAFKISKKICVILKMYPYTDNQLGGTK